LYRTYKRDEIHVLWWIRFTFKHWLLLNEHELNWEPNSIK